MRFLSGPCGRLGAPMTASGAPVDPVPLARLEREWQALAGGRLAARFRAWAELEPALAAFASPRALLRFLRSPGANPDDKDAALAALLARARAEPLAGRVVLEAILPGLKGVAGRLLRDPAEREELWALLFACAWEQIASYPLEQRPCRLAANLLLDTLHATGAGLDRERRQRAELAAEQPLFGLPTGLGPSGDLEALLARAAAAGAISSEEAGLILETRIDGRPLAALAAEKGLAYNTLKLRRQRAERRLLLHLGYPPVPRGRQNRRFSSAWVIRRAAGAGRPDTGEKPTKRRR